MQENGNLVQWCVNDRVVRPTPTRSSPPLFTKENVIYIAQPLFTFTARSMPCSTVWCPFFFFEQNLLLKPLKEKAQLYLSIPIT
jgi:hypothetical protein